MKKTDPWTKEDYQDEVLQLHRKTLNGVQLHDINFADQLTGDDKVKFLQYCSLVVGNPWFEKIFSALYWPNIVHAGTQAKNYDIVTFNRATGNGVALTREFFEKYNRKWEIEFGTAKEDFDAQKPFENVGQ